MMASATASLRRGAPRVPIRMGGILSETSAEGNSSYGKGRTTLPGITGPDAAPIRFLAGALATCGGGIRRNSGPKAYVVAAPEAAPRDRSCVGCVRGPDPAEGGWHRRPPLRAPSRGCAYRHLGSNF